MRRTTRRRWSSRRCRHSRKESWHEHGSIAEPAPARRSARRPDQPQGDRDGEMSVVSERREIVVIGGGQAGLAIGYLLAQRERSFTILEAADTPAAAWRGRWDSLGLFTPARYDSLPGRAFPGPPDAYPGRDDVVAYLTDYAREFELPVELDSPVRAVRA